MWNKQEKSRETLTKKGGKNGVIFDLNFGVLTTFLTKNFVPNGVYTVWNVYEPTGDAVRKMGNGAYMVMVAFGMSL